MRPRVLIVDDSLTVRMDLGEALEQAGFETALCATAQEARASLAAGGVALLLLDVHLPDADGVALLGELKAAPATAAIPIMLLSSEAEVRDRVRGLRCGADEYVGKPYDMAYVVSRARELAGRAAGTAEGPPTVLVIEDSETYREELREALEAAGYRVIPTPTGEAGLHAAVDERPDAIVVDGQLPGIDGATVIRRVRLDASLRRTPCLLLTASGDAADEMRSLDSGADAYVRKTEDVGIVLVRLGALLRSRRAPDATDAAGHLGPKRILAVDDSPTYLHELAGALRGEGYDVALARSGEEALELLGTQPVDCILLDLLMPGLSGQETCRRIKESPRWRDIPLAILTSLEENGAMIASINAGADDYITKSSNFEVLKARLRAQLRRKQFEDEHRSIRDQLLRKELEAREARAAHDLAEARAVLLADLAGKNAELARANEELDRERNRAQQESRFKSRFLASMSHELRTPLNAIIGFSELLHEELFGQLNATQKDYVHNVLVSGRHLLSLINDVLDLSKIEAGRVDLQREWAGVGVAVDAVQAVIRPLAANQRVTVEVDVPRDLPPLNADMVRLKQVLYNLLSNAIKFTPAGGVVRLRARADGERLRIVVEDTGVGIRSEDLPRLFREFEQLDPDGAKREGTGLGLALSRRLVELHGGTISVASEVGRGSTFTVELPLPPLETAA